MKAILSTTVFKNLHLFANFGIAIQGDVLSESSQNDFSLWGIGIRYPLHTLCTSSFFEGLSLVSELERSLGHKNNDNIASGKYTDRDVEFRLGLIKKLSWFNLGVTGAAGINEDSPEWEFQVVLSRTFDDPVLSKE